MISTEHLKSRELAQVVHSLFYGGWRVGEGGWLSAFFALSQICLQIEVTWHLNTLHMLCGHSMLLGIVCQSLLSLKVTVNCGLF